MNKKTILIYQLLFFISMIFINPVGGYYLNGTINIPNAYIIRNWEGTENVPYPKQIVYPFDCKYSINYMCMYSSPNNYTQSNSSGYYSINNISTGDNITVFKLPEYYINTTNNMTITSNMIRNVNLTVKPTGTITGCVYWGSYTCFKQTIIRIYSHRIRWFI